MERTPTFEQPRPLAASLAAAIPAPRSSDDMLGWVLKAQRRVSRLLRTLVEGLPAGELQEQVLAEVCRLADAVALVVTPGAADVSGVDDEGLLPAEELEALLAQASSATGRGPLRDLRTLVVPVPETQQLLVVRSRRNLLPIDLVLVEPLLDLFALVDQQDRERRSTAERERLDPLTGLPNSLALREQVELAERRAGGDGPAVQLLLVRLFDADLRTVLGEELTRSAATVRDVVRAEDLVAYLGGSTFAVLVQDAAAEQLPTLAARLQSHLVAALGGAQSPLHVDVRVSPAATGSFVSDEDV